MCFDSGQECVVKSVCAFIVVIMRRPTNEGLLSFKTSGGGRTEGQESWEKTESREKTYTVTEMQEKSHAHRVEVAGRWLCGCACGCGHVDGF